MDPVDVWIMSKIFIKKGMDTHINDSKLLYNDLIEKLAKNIEDREQSNLFLQKGLLRSILNHKNIEKPKILNGQNTVHANFNGAQSLYSYYAAQAMSALIQKYDDTDVIAKIANEIAIKMVEKDKSA